MVKPLLNIIKDWKTEAKADGLIHVNYGAPYKKELILYTGQPGMLIGRAGDLFYKYKAIIQEKYPHIKEVKLIEVDGWYIK